MSAQKETVNTGESFSKLCATLYDKANKKALHCLADPETHHKLIRNTKMNLIVFVFVMTDNYETDTDMLIKFSYAF